METTHAALLLGGVALGAFGALGVARDFGTEAMAMQGTHWVMLLVALAVGYAAARFFPQLGQKVGLP